MIGQSLKSLCTVLCVLQLVAWDIAAAAPAADTAASVRMLDIDAIRILQKHAAAVRERGPQSKAVTAARNELRMAEQRIDAAMKGWPSTGTRACASPKELSRVVGEAASFAGVYFRRFAGPLHTEVADLKEAPRCAGDVMVNRMVPEYFDVIERNDLAHAMAVLRIIDQQYKCMSVRQLHRAAFSLRAALEYTRLSFAKKGGPCATEAIKVFDGAALNLVYRTFERSLPFGSMSFNWLHSRKDAFVAALDDPDSNVSRMRLWAGSRSDPDRIVQLPAQCAAGEVPRFAGAGGQATCDALATFFRSLDAANFGVGDCFGGDLEPLGLRAGQLASQLGCRKSCDSLAALGFPGSAGALEQLPSPLTASLRTSIGRTGRTPLGAAPSEVMNACGQPGSGGGGALLGGTRSSASTLTCMLESAATEREGQSLLTCMSRGLTSSPYVSGGAPLNLRSCGLSSKDGSDPSPPPKKTEPPGSEKDPKHDVHLDVDLKLTPPSNVRVEPGPPRTPHGVRLLEGQLQLRPPPDLTVPPDSSLSEEERAWRAVEESLRDREGTTDASLLQRLEELGRIAEMFRIDLSTPAFELRTPNIAWSCGEDSGCHSTCTSGDRFTQIFQTCSERMRQRPSFRPLVHRWPPQEDGAVPSALLACMGGEQTVPLPGMCPAMNCPPDQEAIAGADGRCRCGQAERTAPGSSANSNRACAILCPQGTVPISHGGGCGCQSTAGSGSGPSIRPQVKLPQVGSPSTPPDVLPGHVPRVDKP